MSGDRRFQLGDKSTWAAEAARLRFSGREYSDAELRELLTWLQDTNWPGSGDVAHVLIRAGERMLPFVREVLRGDDYDWQVRVLENLVSCWPRTRVAELEPDLRTLLWVKCEGDFGLSVECLSLLADSGLLADDEVIRCGRWIVADAEDEVDRYNAREILASRSASSGVDADDEGTPTA